MSFDWKDLKGYAFPPFSLLNKIARKIQTEQAEVIIVTPFWQTQTWFPAFMSMAVESPLLLARSHNLLRLVHDPSAVHPLHERLDLLAWRLSGDLSRGEAYRRELRNSLQSPELRERTSNTRPHGTAGRVGAIDGVPIPLKTLWRV